MEKKRFLETGKIVNTHGLRGEVKILPWADAPEFLLRLGGLYIDGRRYRTEQARVHKEAVIVKLEGVDSVGEAMALKNKVVYLDRNEVKLDEGAWFVQDALGLPVYDINGAELGKLAEVLELPGGDVFVVKGETERLIPSKGGFVKEVDLDGGRIVVELIDGM